MDRIDLKAQPGSAAARVLLVEDDRTNQMLAERILSKQGYRVAVAENGRLAIEALARERFDVVLMDVQMPVMSGLEAAVAIRTLEAGTDRRVPIIALTAHAGKGDADACFAAGMDAHLTKPIRAPRLLETMQRFLAARPAPAPAAPAEAVDRALLLDNTQGDLELLDELLTLFPLEIPKQVAAVEAAIAAGDAPLLAWIAHRLKGALATFGARPAAESAGRIERVAQVGDLAGAAREAATLADEVASVGAALAELGASLGAAAGDGGGRLTPPALKARREPPMIVP